MTDPYQPAADTNTPAVSVVMANRNGAPYLKAAMASVLCQGKADLELILTDDASTDDSRAIAGTIAERDPRVRLLTSDTPGGPAVARNRALEVARGDWIAIIDSDDLVHPQRFERMIDRAETLGVDVVADDLIYFGANLGRTLLGALALEAPWQPSAADILGAEAASPPVPVGYLKPMVRRTALGARRYRTYLTVGEDYDLLLRVLLGGARLAVLPEAYYLYRRHSSSTSHRLSEPDIAAMLRATDELRLEIPTDLVALLDQRQARQVRMAKFARLVGQVNSPGRREALRLLRDTPGLVWPLFQATVEHVTRRMSRPPGRTAPPLLSLVPADSEPSVPPTYARVDVPSPRPPGFAARLVAKAGTAEARLRVHGREGLDALGYIPGWSMAELFPPNDGWTEAEQRCIAALPWPTTCG